MKMKILACLLVILLPVNLYCSGKEEISVNPFVCNKNSEETEKLKLYEHPNGLLICFPSYLKHTGKIEIVQTDLGFTLTTEFPSRYPTTITIERINSEGSPKGEWPQQAYINKQLTHYRVDNLGGGSGGTEYALNIWQPCAGGYVSLKLGTQHEFNPDFSLAWQLLASTKIKAT